MTINANSSSVSPISLLKQQPRILDDVDDLKRFLVNLKTIVDKFNPLSIDVQVNPLSIDVQVDDDDVQVDDDVHFDRQVDWLDLPGDILSLVSDKLVHFKDFIRFGAVCKPWHSIYSGRRHQFRRKPQLPLLMLPNRRDERRNYKTRSLFSLVDKALSTFQPRVHYNLLCPGSCHGWLVTVSPKFVDPEFEVTLLNPFIPDPNKNTIKLPPLTEFEVINGEDVYRLDCRFLHKVVLSADPATTSDYVVMAIYSRLNRLAFFKPGNKTWTSLRYPDGSLHSGSADVTYYQGKFHSVNCLGVVDAWDIDHHPPVKQTLSPHVNSSLHGPLRRYIVESSGHLLQVLRRIKYDDDMTIRNSNYSTVEFLVFKLDPRSLKWIRIDNLQGHSLFLGDNASLSLPVSGFPECKPNSIYYTDDFYSGYCNKEEFRIGPHDMGIFSVEDGTIEKYYPTTSNIILPAPIWIQPTLFCG